MGDRPRRITLVISALGPGGAERVMATIANHWAERGWAVTLLTLEPRDAEPFFRIDDRVRVRNLDLRQVSRGPIRAVINNLRRVAIMQAAIRRARPDAVISFMDTMNVLTLISTVGMPVPVIVEEHADPRQCHLRGRGESYARSSIVAPRLWLPSPPPRWVTSRNRSRSRGAVIPNPVEVPAGFAPGGDSEAAPTIVGMGRLGHEKGFDLMLRAFAEVAGEFPEWRVEIWGEGPCSRISAAWRRRSSSRTAWRSAVSRRNPWWR